MSELAFRDGVMDRIRVREPRFDERAFLFVLSALEYAQARQVERRHLSGRELAEACREKPDLLVDVATLTGAARVALGPDLPALFCDDETLAADILAAGRLEDDPLWRMPLHKPYRKLLDSKVADLNNVSDGPHAGAITAALFLKDFVDPAVPWAHIDVLAWNLKPQRGRPEGGEAQTLRALWRVLRQRFGRA